MNLEFYAFRCEKCGDKVCLCSPNDDGKFVAHCMSCDNSTYKIINKYAESESEAVRIWNLHN